MLAAAKPVPRMTFGVAVAVTPVCADERLMAAAIAIALAARVEEVVVVSDAVSSVDNACPIATPLITILLAFNKP